MASLETLEPNPTAVSVGGSVSVPPARPGSACPGQRSGDRVSESNDADCRHPGEKKVADWKVDAENEQLLVNGRKAAVHADWYEDWVAEGDVCFRLDFRFGESEYQAQLSFESTSGPWLFLERDNRPRAASAPTTPATVC